MTKLLKLVLVLAVVGGGFYFYFFKSNIPSDLKSEYIKIPTGTDVDGLKNLLATEGVISDEGNFQQWASWLDFKTVRAGRFRVKSGWSSYDLIKHLQTGEQSPVKVVLNNERKPEQVAAKIAKVLEKDSAAFAQTFSDTALLDSLDLSRPTLMCVFLPNTYEVFWNIEPRKFIERMAKEYKRFWTPERVALAKAQGLTPEQAITMASIVDGESKYEDERARVAAAYLNRLKQNIKLQADPTVQFALMEIEGTSSFRRLYNVDYLKPHPYNTYLNYGLPPGPICMPQPSSVDAVLKPAQHNFMYFVAKPDNPGYHTYAETYEQHLVNVKAYQQALAKQKQ